MKQRSREIIASLIRLGITVGPDTSALFLPGLHVFEYEEIYAKLGFDPKNLVGLERDKVKHNRILASNPPFQVVNSTFKKFVKGCDRQFDVINYDSQTFFESLEKDIEALFRKRLLSADGLLIINAMACRNNKAEGGDGLYTLLQHRVYRAIIRIIGVAAKNGYKLGLHQPFTYNSGSTKMVTIPFSKRADSKDIKLKVLKMWGNDIGWEGSFKHSGALCLDDIKKKSLALTNGEDENLLYAMMTSGYKVIL